MVTDANRRAQIEQETYTVIYAVTDTPTRAALLRLFGALRNERDEIAARIEAIEAVEKDREFWFAGLRWFQTISTAVITGTMLIVAQRFFA